jgi:hypothetical protein
LFTRAAKILQLWTRSLYFVWPRSEEFWNLPTKVTQINCILFWRAAKFLEFVNKSNSLTCSAAQRKLLELRVFCSRSENFGIYQQKPLKSTAFCSPAKPKIWNCHQKHCIWLSRAEKFFGGGQQEHCILFGQTHFRIRDCILCNPSENF